MSPPHVALGILFVATGALVVAAACSSEPPPPRDGRTLWTEVGCVNCHGLDGGGMKGFAPTLHGKKQHWTRETLVAYIRDPQGYAAKDARLREQGRGYSLPMPKAVLPHAVEYETLADWVLAMP